MVAFWLPLSLFIGYNGNDMHNLTTYLEHKYSKKLKPDMWVLYKTMAQYLDSKGDEIYTWDENDAYEQYMIDNAIKDYLVLPTKPQWKSFLNDSVVSGLLMDNVIKSKATTLRKLINNINENSNLNQGDMKALNALKDLIDSSEARDDSLIYVQYIAPIRFGEHDNEAIVKELLDNEE